MKNFVRNLALVSVVVLATGCAGQMVKLPIKLVDKTTGELKDGYFAASTASNNPDRSSTYTQLGIDTGLKDEHGKPILREVAGDVTVGPTVVGQALVGVLNGTGAALVNQRTAFRVANKNACNGPTCGNGTIIVNNVKGGEAAALSNSASQSGVDFNAMFESTCQSGNC